MKRVSATLLMLAALVAAISGTATPVAADPSDWTLENVASSRWSPTKVVTLLDSDNPSWNVAIWQSFELPTSTSSKFWLNGERGVIETGWKRTGFGGSTPFDPRGCHSPSPSIITVGYPANVMVLVDPVEDGWDASLWVSDIQNLKPVIQANPSAEYLAYWKCRPDGNDKFDDNQGTYIETQVAEHTTFIPYCNCPVATTSRATQRILPPENGHWGVPDDHSDLRQIQTNAYLPWSHDGHMDTDTASMWQTTNASVRLGLGGYDSPGYFYIQPSTSGLQNSSGTSSSPDTAISRWYRTRSNTTDNGDIPLGSQTGFNADLSFRCPVWSPWWAGVQGSSAFRCKITLSVNTAAGIQQNVPACIRSFYVEGDGAWHVKQPLKTCPQSYPNHNWFNVRIDTNGYAVDVDNVWFDSAF